MEAIRLDFPDVKVVWRIWFGDAYSVRTDVQRILASRPSAGGAIMDNTAKNLYYCHDVVFLDLGHSGGITNIEFVRGMPKLEVAILITGSWTDASPLTACPELEYLEMFSTFCNDLTPPGRADFHSPRPVLNLTGSGDRPCVFSEGADKYPSRTGRSISV